MKITAGKIVLVVVALIGIWVFIVIPVRFAYLRELYRRGLYEFPIRENVTMVETGREDTKVFDGLSSDLKQTVIVPSLQSKLDEGRNIIWCASFDMAWKELKTLYPPDFLQVKGAEETVTLLNNSQLTIDDFPAQSFYAAAGFIQNGIVKKIQAEMKERFPGESVPSFDDIITPSTESIAYSYLQASLSFANPYFDSDTPLYFKDSNGREAKVASFGIRDEDGNKYFRLRRQVKVLSLKLDPKATSRPKLVEFALDLDRDSKPNQVILACVDPKETLGKTVEYVETQMSEDPHRKGRFEATDTLYVPNLNWRIDHSFRELEGDKILKARETIEFHLNRRGVELKAVSNTAVAAIPIDFVYDRPFLIIMKKRGAERPYFVAWIGNEELLTPWAEAGK